MPNITRLYNSACWQPAAEIKRSFARHSNGQASPGQFWRHDRTHGPVILTVIIPTWDGFRDGYLPKLLVQIEKQLFSKLEIIVVKGDPRQGCAINTAASLARGKFLLTLDDDCSLSDDTTFGILVDVMERHPEIGLAGATNQIPENANAFVKRVMRELPRRAAKPVTEITDSDLAEHGCLIMRKDEFMEIGGENELIPRGLDPYLRQEYRNHKKRVVVVPGAIYHHLPPKTLKKLMHQFYRNGQQAAFANRYYPQWVIETPVGHGEFKAMVPLSRRIFRFPLRMIAAIFTGRFIYFLNELCYGIGFIIGWFKAKEENQECYFPAK